MKFLDGQVVAFLGDSITEHRVAVNNWMETQTDGLPPIGTRLNVERHEPRGWTTLLADKIHLAYPERRIRYINAGRGGHSSRQMLARFEADILAQRPHWLLVSAGVVEVRRTYQPDRAGDRVPLNEYVANLSLMVSKARQGGVQVVLLEPTPHARPVTNGLPQVTLQDVNNLTCEYATAMRKVAQETGIGFVPLFETFLGLETRLSGKASLYADEVHLNAKGDLLYAEIVYQYLDSQ